MIAAVMLFIILLYSGAAIAVAARAEGDIDTWSALQAAIDRAEDGEAIVLSEDLTALDTDAEITVPAGKRLTLDLNGHVLDSAMDPNQTERKRCVINIRAGTMLTLLDSGGRGVITGGFHDNGGGILNRGTLIIEGGCVTGNAALHSGGGIANYGTMILAGGSVRGNAALRDGSEVFNDAKGHMTCGDGEAKRGAFRNEGTLTVIDARNADAHIEDMPVIKRFMAQLSVIPSTVLLVALLLTVRLDAYMSRERKQVMVVIVMLVFSLIIQNYLDNKLSLTEAYNALRIPVSVYGYAVRPVILVMFLYIVKPHGRYRAAWTMVGVNAAVYMTAFFSDIAFCFTSNGHFKSGPLRNTCTLVSAVLYAWLFFLTLRQFRPRARKESWLPIFVTALIGGAVAMDYSVAFSEQPVSYLTMAIAISCVFYYIWLHLQFVREHEDALHANQRIQIMMSQIQPHFLFNTLSTIQALCVKAPQIAVYAIERFGVYLRKNLESLNQPNLIPLSKELEHTRAYAEIEQLRFPNIQVDYDIQVMDIMVPALSIQPLVENAIRHGVRGRENGRVTVITRPATDENLIIIRDNGTGFDVRSFMDEDGKHIGIANVRSRLEKMCGGTLDIDSRIGEGTTIALRIPVTRQI